ncbi:MAG: DegV family protein [Anaerolineae bacterium]
MVKIIGDTTSGFPKTYAKQYDIPIIPQVINIDGVSYLEGIDIDYHTFLTKLRTVRELPKTAAPPPELFVEAYQRFAPSKEPILCILPSAIVSGTVRSATVALQMAIENGLTDLDVRIIDTQLIASPVATLIKLAAEWAIAGMDADTIEARVRALSRRGRIYFSVETLKYLAMGGRIGGAAALVGSALQVKPVLTFRNGQVEAFEKVRTHKRAVDRLKELVTTQISRDGDGFLSIMHADVADEAQELAGEMRARLGISDVPILAVPPAIVTHGGPGVLGAGFFTAQEQTD